MKTRSRLHTFGALILIARLAWVPVFGAETRTDPPPAAAQDRAAAPAAGPNTTARQHGVAGLPGLPRDLFLFSERHTNNVRLVPGPEDRNIARFAALMLQRQHYRQQRIDDEVSGKFLDRYLDTLDRMHMYFQQSDLKEFEAYRTTLDDLTVKAGDTSPAHLIFNRFLERFGQQTDFIIDQLKNGAFDFTTDDVYPLSRKNLPRPKDLAEARRLWRDRLRYEYLQEKLGLTRGEVIARIVREKIEQDKRGEIAKALRDKLGKERIDELVRFIAEQKAAAPADIGRAVEEKLEREKHQEIVKTILRRYSRLSRMLHEYDSDNILEMYLTALAHVFDPHSDYMGRATLENFAIGMKLSLFGIGALLQSEDGYCKIKELTPGGPAIKSKKLKPGDRIIGVAQGEAGEAIDVVDMKLSKVVEMIRGPKGTVVRLTVIPADAADPSIRKSITLVRDEIKLEDQEAKAKLIEVPGERTVRLGVIDLPSFYAEFIVGGRPKGKDPKSTTADVRKLIQKLKDEKIDGIILDLRRNGGGSLEEAINLTGLFIPEGPVVQVRDPDDRRVVDSDEDPSIYYDGPLVVLTSRLSASASEILAGALQDYSRAVIVGDSSTHGKGTVQSLVELKPIMEEFQFAPTNNPGALKITIRKFYRASGSSTQLKGVTPDLILPSINNHAEVGEASLDNPLPWDTVPSAHFEKMNYVQAHLPELKKRSDARIASDRDFAYLLEEIERYKKMVADKSVSLNEEQRLKEKKEAEARGEARKNELKNRPEPREKTFEITLKHVDQPGLPAPVSRNNPAEADANPADLDPDDPAADADDKVPALDITLEETKRILIDLIGLSSRERAVASTK